jgi:hypothetical protein
VVTAGALVLLRDGQPEETDPGELADDGPVDLLGPVPVPDVRHDLAVDEVPCELPQRGVLLAERQIHDLHLTVNPAGRRGDGRHAGQDRTTRPAGPVHAAHRREPGTPDDNLIRPHASYPQRGIPRGESRDVTDLRAGARPAITVRVPSYDGT